MGSSAVLAAWLLFAWPRADATEVSAAQTVSVIQVPLELDLAPLFAAAESSLPTRAGHWPRWRKWHGVEVRYRAWRGPLWLGMQGGQLQAQAHVRYQVQARKRLIGDIGLSAGCGVEEAPRQALIGALARLDWAPDWSLHPRVRILPTRVLDRCEMTVADVDVSPVIGRVFDGQLEESLGQAMRGLSPHLGRLREEASRAWLELQTPREVTPGLWLHIRPLGIALAPLQGSGSRVQTAVWLAVLAELTREDGSGLAPTPLPPLAPFRPHQPGLRFAMALQLDYPGLSAALSERLSGKSFEIGGHRARIEEIRLSAAGQDLELTVEVAGDLAGKLTIMARPGFDTDTQTLKLEDVDFIFDADDPDQDLIANLFYQRIRARIETEANGLLEARSTGVRSTLQAALAEGLPSRLAPSLSDLRIASLGFEVGQRGLTLSGSAEGVLKLGHSAAVGKPQGSR
jgi:hypothetical protein